MGYPFDLDDASDTTLIDELRRRVDERSAGKCDYCHRALNSQPSCRFPDRHSSPVGIIYELALVKTQTEVSQLPLPIATCLCLPGLPPMADCPIHDPETKA